MTMKIRTNTANLILPPAMLPAVDVPETVETVDVLDSNLITIHYGGQRETIGMRLIMTYSNAV